MTQGRDRDLLPLPLIQPEPKAFPHPHGCGHRESVNSKRNRVRREDNLAKANEVIVAVNEMAGFDRLPGPGPSTQAQRDSQQKILRSMARLPRPDSVLPRREAIHELLHLCPSSEYMPEEGTRSTVRPYEKSLVSLPELGADFLDASQLIDDQGREVLEQFEHSMLAPDFVTGKLFETGNRAKTYLDEVFRQKPEVYADFITDLAERNMVEFRTSATCVITPFFVNKKNGRLRLVLDCRSANELFCAPPDIALAAGYTFGQLEVEAGQTLFTAQSDVKDYFYSIGLPEGLRKFFCLPSVSAAQFSKFLPGRAQNPDLCESNQVFPVLKVVPMGWSWAMWVAQRIHQHQAELALNTGPEQVLVDGRPPPSLQTGLPVLIPYADNMNICGINKQAVQDAKDRVVKQLRQVKFRVHEEQDATPVVQALGFEIDGLRGEVRPLPYKREKLRTTLLWLATRPRISGAAVERVIGHCVHMFMVRREFLSVFRSVYDFKQAHYKSPYKLWRSAAQEFRWAAALLLVCKSDLQRPWCAQATASDACLSGTAVATLNSSAETVRDIGQCRELWRFKSKDPLNRARDTILKLDPFRDVNTVMPVSTAFEDPFQLNLDFRHVPQEFACSDEWVTRFSSRMTIPEHITLLEGRATLQAIRHKLRTSRNFGLKHLHCGDNLGMVLAFDRGRAKAVPLLICCRKAAAYSVAGDCSFTHRWIPSEWNAADAASRKWEQGAAQKVSKREEKRIIEAVCYPKNPGKQKVQEQAWQFLRGHFERDQEADRVTPDQAGPDETAAAQVGSRQRRGDACDQAAGPDGAISGETAQRAPDFLGGSSSRTSDCRRIQTQTADVSRLLQSKEVEDARREKHRRSFAPFSQPVLHRGMDSRRGGQVSGRCVRLAASVAKGRPCTKQESPPGLEKPGPGCNQAPDGVATHRTDCSQNDRSGVSGRGLSSSLDVLHLRQARGSLRHPQARPGGEHGAGSDVGHQPPSSRRPAELKGGCQQRNHPPGLPRDAMARCGSQLPKHFSGCLSSANQLPTGDCSLEPGSKETEVGQAQWRTLSTSPLRSKLGPVKELQVQPGREVERSLELRPQPSKVRAACIGCSTLRGAPQGNKGPGRSCSSAPPSAGPWKMWPAAPSKLKPVLELFAGCARLSKACVQVGFPAEAWDIEYNLDCNLCCPKVLTKLIQRIKAHQFSFVHLGTPCTSWSRARRYDGRGPGPLRDDAAHLWGLPGLSSADAQKVAQGNRLLEVSVQVVHACISAHVPWSLENPASSRLWLTPQIAAIQKHGATFQLADFCMYGTPWRKATAFLTWGCPSFDFLQCSGPFCCCSRTLKKHVPLSGATVHGQWLTRVAQPYPPALCAAVAVSLRHQQKTAKSDRGSS